MKAAFVLFCLVLCLSLIHCQESSQGLLVQLNLYDCYDPDYINPGNSAKITLEKSTLLLPRSDSGLTYTKTAVFQNTDGNAVGIYGLTMYCYLTSHLEQPVFAFTGEYKGTMTDKDGNQIQIETTKITPMLQGRFSFDSPRIRTTLENVETIDIENGAILDDLSFYLVKDPNGVNCRISYDTPNTGNDRGCVTLADYNPNVVKKAISKNCRVIQGSDPVSHENCGPTLKLKKEETITTSTEESISVGSSTTSTLNIGASFKVNVGVEGGAGPVKGSLDVERGISTSYGVSTETSQQNARTSSTVNTYITEREFTVEHGRKIVEFRDIRDCSGTGEALGCLDTDCTYAFKLEYFYSETVVTERTEISTINCSNNQ